MHYQKSKERDIIQRQSSKILAERRCNEGYHTKPKAIKTESKGSLELGAVEILYHGRRTHAERGGRGSYIEKEKKEKSDSCRMREDFKSGTHKQGG